MQWKRLSAVIATGVLVTSTVAACSSSKSKSGGGGGGGSTNPSGSASVPDAGAQPKSKVKATTMTGDCAPFGVYGSYPGKTVTMYSSITDPEGTSLVKSWKQFEKCTGVTVKYVADKEFESALKTKVEGGNAPDLAIFPQPESAADLRDLGQAQAGIGRADQGGRGELDQGLDLLRHRRR